MLKQALYVENEELKKRVKELEKKKDLEPYIYMMAIPTIGLLISLIAWSVTWSWVWYGYLAFYSAIPHVVIAIGILFEMYELPE